MSTKLPVKQSLPLLGNSISSLFQHPKILYPFAVIAFIQLLFMEILFFAPRFPLSVLFKEMILRLGGKLYLHYPFNFDLVNHWFQSGQAWIFLFISPLFIGKAVAIIAKINRGQPVEDKMPVIGVKRYVNLIVSFLIILLMVYGLTSFYGLLIRRAVQIRSTSGIYFMIKQAVLIGSPYFNLVISVIVTTLFAYVVPIIVLENRNVFEAVWKNFQIIWASFWTLLIVIGASSMFYIPVLLIRSNQRWFFSFVSPELWQTFVIVSLLFMLLIDAIQYAAMTTSYLLTKEE